MSAWLHVERAVMLGRHIGPPIPGRDAHLLAQIIDGEDRAALVAAGEDQGGVNAGQRVTDNLDQRGLPFAGDFGDVNLPLAHKLVNDGTVAEGADQGRVPAQPGGFVRERRLDLRHPVDVGLQVVRHAHHARPVVGVHEEGRGLAFGEEAESLAGLFADKNVGGQGGGTVGEAKREQQYPQQGPQDAASVSLKAGNRKPFG